MRIYLRSALWLTPAFFIWLFANAFLLPKLKQGWALAGLQGSKAQMLMDVSSALQGQFEFAFFGLVAVLVLLEFFWTRWPRYRRVVVSGIALLIHTAVLVGITAIATAALLALPILTRSK